jgi:uncharacterized 2Fe-2S/4Fe-4S cluster protein (DUF4445 family)
MTGKEERQNTAAFTVRFLPFDVYVKVPPHTFLLDAVRLASLPLSAPCGGEGTCGDCVVQILKGTYQTRPSAGLSEQLGRQGYVLACLTEITDDLTVDLPQFEQLWIKSVASFVLPEDHKDGISATYEVSPIVGRIDLDLPRPTLEDNYGDLTRIQREIEKIWPGRDFDSEYSVLRQLAGATRQEAGRVSAIVFTGGQTPTLIDVRPTGGAKGIFGIACDIGTTTVALNLVNLESGDILDTALGLNRQIKCGEDIISRINYARKPGRLKELQDLAVATVNDLIEKAAQAHEISARDIYYVSVSGNTTMTHLLLNLEPRYIREEPYVPTFNRLPFIRAHDLGLKTNPEARIHLAPAVGSYVGGDITAGLLATPMLRDSDTVSVFIDAGTNGELVIGNKDWLMTCACSAGPAFEGRGVGCGMPATEGAIERVQITEDGQLHYEVIGDTKPRGICGSGLVDLLSELLVHGYIDRQGKLRRPDTQERYVESSDGAGFLVERGSDSYWGHDLVITEKDITNIVRTKGAIFSACSLLLKQVGLSFDKVDAFYIAGGFGQHLDIENAIRIGLLPDMHRSRFHYLGNSSLFGAYLILISDENRRMVSALSEKMTYVELNTEPTYMNEYTGALFLPHTDLDLFPSVRDLLGR